MRNKGLTRRQLATAAAALPALGQNTPATPANELEAAKSRVQQASARLRKFRIDTQLEPSFVFKA